MRTRNLAILLFDEVEVLDFAGPFEVFSVAAGLDDPEPFRVYTVAETDGVIRAIGGLTLTAAYTLSNAPTPDVLVVPGGNGSRRAMEDPVILDWVRHVQRGAELVLSVCSGARILAATGLLSGLHVTTHHQVVQHLRELAPDANVDPSRRFIDTGRIVTTGGISAGIDGSLHVVDRLIGEDLARRTAEHMEYDWRPEGGAAASTHETGRPLVKDLAIALEDRPGTMADVGEALGRAGVSVEGGGAFVVAGRGVGHFLFADGQTARRALEAAGMRVLEEREVVTLRLDQGLPGQLGLLTRRMAEAGVNIEVLYSDHEHRLILVVDDVTAGRAVAAAWMSAGRGA